MSLKVRSSDLLVIGSGVAGLSVALGIARCRPDTWIRILAKEGVEVANTSLAQGGIAAPLGGNDHPEEHAKDTIRVGGRGTDPSVVRMVTGEAFERIQELLEQGMPFDRDRTGALALGREGGHSKARVLRAGDRTGKALHHTLLKRLRSFPNVELWEYSSAMDLILSEAGCAGAYVVDRKKRELFALRARNTVLATGGAGQVYLRTSNSRVATGDGFGIAQRAGLSLVDMGNFQFHPTAFAWDEEERAFLISEAVRGEGARLKDPNGACFVERYDERGELAPRKRLSRIIASEMERLGVDHVLLDATHFTEAAFEDRFPSIHAYLIQRGIHPSVDPIPVAPAAHYSCGGVPVDRLGWTGISGLFACGELVRTGMHGADRTPSNSLLEAVVFADRVRIGLMNDPWPWRGALMKGGAYREQESEQERLRAHVLRERLRRVMTDKASVLISRKSLREAAAELEEIREEMKALGAKGSSPFLMEDRNMLSVALAIVEDRMSS